MTNPLNKMPEHLERFGQSDYYQSRVYKRYQKDKEKIQVFLKCADFLGLIRNGRGPFFLAYLIERLSKSYPFSWKKRLHIALKKCADLPPSMYETVLMHLILKENIKHFENQINGIEPKLWSNEEVELRLNHVRDYKKRVLGYLKKNERLHTILMPDELIPDWWHIAMPKNRFYKDDKLEEIIEPLIHTENSRRAYEVINRIHYLVKKHTWRQFFDAKLDPILKKLQDKIKHEIMLRDNIKNHQDLDLVRHLTHDLKNNLKEQKRIFSDFEKTLKKTSVVNIDKHEEVYNLIKELKDIIKKELS